MRRTAKPHHQPPPDQLRPDQLRPDAELPAFAQQVLDLVDAIPPGKVLAYGDIAEYLGAGGPRQVGRVMSQWGGAVPWHRVVHADGTPAPADEAVGLLIADGTPMRGDRVDMRQARWDGEH